MKKYELILFDADGTLFDFDKAEEIALEKTFEDYNLEYKVEQHLEKYKVHNHKAWSDFEKGLTTPDKLKVERFISFFNELQIDLDFHKFSETYLDELSQVTEFLPGAKNLLDSLYAKTKLVLITNGLKKVQRRRFSKEWVNKYFAAIIISEEIGCAKPCNEIFTAAFDSVNHTNKSTAIIIGDKLSSDILGGINFGIDSCWYNPNSENGDGITKPTYTISELSQLENLLFPEE
ncbi:MAG: YjjG family noncanonical pyrimidine nucleotidase [Melioribacteraceae bacterium]|nr:YjjG family noncanonical pyrimidine nucleotidase [Melioribacteraceae bacterium]MCF8266095.1 YjjG family noncanonical pyrimidine nucleotidase [Melioribacteraceae bacterium]MCF8432569.1 YjjG family noncanonical pyrimidine nucleotidase [Melioribacteraceae bacterium]